MDARGAAMLGLYSPGAAARPDPDRLVRLNMGLVRKIAWQVFSRVSRSSELDDLIQTGLIAAVAANAEGAISAAANATERARSVVFISILLLFCITFT